ncbi:MAG: ABC transporter ATP-binding protein [Firmicutes bacterium]|nr:ABC transporter ATP-binding protein [Bacillota bacterium]MBQ6663629.1 ABC transporter ATP-binding protein [Bacillota bacterium]
MEKVLKLEHVNVTYSNRGREVYAVQDATFDIFKGDSIGIVGESGSGKSTLAMAVLRLLNENTTVIDGLAEFEGKNLLAISQKEMDQYRWKDLSVVFQKAMSALSPVHRIRTQVEDIYRVHEPHATDKEIEERMTYLLKLVNLAPRVYNLYPHEMSGGMLQRVAIAISLLHGPKLIVFDEATTALDVITQSQILEEVVAMEKEMDMARIMITHDMSVVAASCKKVAVMYAGRFVEIGDVRSVFKDPKHPYTQGLLASFPSLKGENAKLKAIPGFMPNLSIKPEGCNFAPRCPYATERCKKVRPTQQQMEDGRMIACLLYEEGGTGNE